LILLASVAAWRAFVALLGARRYRPYLFWVFLPLFVAMCVSTIYGRYHYIADVLAGILVGALGFILAERLMAAGDHSGSLVPEVNCTPGSILVGKLPKRPSTPDGHPEVGHCS